MVDENTCQIQDNTKFYFGRTGFQLLLWAHWWALGDLYNYRLSWPAEYLSTESFEAFAAVKIHFEVLMGCDAV